MVKVVRRLAVCALVVGCATSGAGQDSDAAGAGGSSGAVGGTSGSAGRNGGPTACPPADPAGPLLFGACTVTPGVRCQSGHADCFTGGGFLLYWKCVNGTWANDNAQTCPMPGRGGAGGQSGGAGTSGAAGEGGDAGEGGVAGTP